MATLDRTKANPWSLKTLPGTAEYTMHVDEKDGVRVLVYTVGKTVLLYDARCIDDLHTHAASTRAPSTNFLRLRRFFCLCGRQHDWTLLIESRVARR
ncbi:MAG TPA: hypothetical protein VGS07_06985 [Thermoanaerobaculia bacterium]|jgi:hypothetical protein|nr:hypothetical protein [Thermoanaerobaculia bacterium]